LLFHNKKALFRVPQTDDKGVNEKSLALF